MIEKEYVLIVDNQKEWLERLTKLLGNQFTLVPANTYDEALRILKQQSVSFHVVITEIYLNESSTKQGFDLVKFVRQEFKGRTQYIILTRSENMDDLKEALGTGWKPGLGVFEYKQKSPKKYQEKKEEAQTMARFNDDEFCEIVRHAVKEAENIREHIDIFVVMPFAKKYDPIYKYIEEVSHRLGKVCKRADRPISSSITEKKDSIMSDIRKGILNAEIVIAELSDGNPNVLFEIGISNALDKKMILISSESNKEKIPEILSEKRIIFYQPELGGEEELKEKLHNRLEEISVHSIRHNQVSNIVSPYCFIITSQAQDGSDTYRAIIKKMLDSLKMPYTYLWDDQAWQTSGDSQKSKPELIEESLYNSCTVIADLSGYLSGDDSMVCHDPTSFYLAGLAYEAGKKFRFLYRKGQEPPFDIKHLNLLRYTKNSEEEREDACNLLQIVLKTWQKECAQKIVLPESTLLTEPYQSVNVSISILFLAAEPTDQVRLRLGQEFREIQEELLKSRERDRFNLELPQLSLRSRDITRVLRETNAQIVHFSGHGESGGQLCFETADGGSLPVEPEILADLFRKFSKKIKCVILNACYSEKQAEAIFKHIDYVIGMRHGISDSAAIAFSIGFYQALGAGEDIEEAFESGKIQSGMQSAPEYQTPVLHKRKP